MTTDSHDETLAGWIAHGDLTRRWNVSGKRHTPRFVLARLGHDEDSTVRCGIAQNPATPADALVQLADDTLVNVLINLLHNPAAPPDALDQLSRHDDPFVRQGVARHPNTAAPVLARLSRDPRQRVRRNVAQHPRTPELVRELLRQDDRADVRAAACAPPPARTASDDDVRVRIATDLPFTLLDHDVVHATLFATYRQTDLPQLRTALALLDTWTATFNELWTTAARLTDARNGSSR